MAELIPLRVTIGSPNTIGEMGVGDFVGIANGGTGATTASAARTALGVDPAGTDNSTDVTLAGTPSYLTLAGQTLTLGLINLASEVQGTLPLTSGGTGATTASAARTALGVDPAGTDNSTDVTLAGAPSYLTLAGQTITLGLINLASEVQGTLPVSSGGTGATTAAAARTALGVDPAGTDNSTPVTLSGSEDYLSLVGQTITQGPINLATNVTGILPVANYATGTPDGTKFVRDDGTLAVPAGTGSGEVNTGANVGTAGIGVYKTKVGTDLQFKKLNTGSSKVVLVDDTANDEIDIDIAPGNILTSTLNNDAGWNAYSHPNHSGDVVSASDGATTIGAGVVSNSKLSPMGAWTLKLRNSGVSGDPQDVAIGTLAEEASPTTGHKLLAEVGGQLRFVDVGNLPTGGGGEVNTGSNVGTAGVGIFKGKVGVDFQYKKLNAGSSKVALVDDTANDEIDIDIAPGNILTSTLNNDAGWNAYSHPNHSGDVTSTGDGATVIASGAVTLSKMASIAGLSFMGKATAGAGTPQVLDVPTAQALLNVEDGANAYSHPNHSGDVASAGDGTTTIGAGVVTNSKLSPMAGWTLKLRNNSTSGDPQDVAIGSLTEEASPTTGHKLLAEVGGQLRFVDVGNLPTGGGGEVNTGSNVGTAGIGVFKGKVGVDFQYKKLNTGSSKVVLVDDTANDEIDIDVAPGNILTSTLNNDAGWNAYSHPNHSGDVTSTGDGATVIAAGAVSTSKISDKAITLPKLADMATASFLGRLSASTGVPEVLSAANARSILNVADGATANSPDATLLNRSNHTGTQLLSTISDAGALAGKSTVGTADIDLGAVTLSRLEDRATQTFLGRNSVGAGAPEELNAATARTILNVADGATANSPDATLLSRANHTGTQALATISDAGSLAAKNVVATADLQNSSVTLAKLENRNSQTFLGRNSVGAGVPEELSAATARSILNVADGATANSPDATLLSRSNHTGTQLLSTISDAGALASKNTVGALDIDASAVGTSQLASGSVTGAKIANATVTLDKVADIAAQSLLGNNTGSPATTLELTNSQVQAMLGTDTPLGAQDAGKLVALDSAGEVDKGFLNKKDVGELLDFPTYQKQGFQSDAGAPVDNLGVAGDRYVDETSGILYVKRYPTSAELTFPKGSDYTISDYTPSDVTAPNATYHTAEVFLPDPTNVPSSGFPWVLYCSAGNFVQTAAGTTIADGSRLGEYLKRGIAVVWIGVTGRNTSTTNVFWEPGSTGFDSYAASDFYPEKDAIWALQFVKANASAYDLDSTRVAVDGVSSGAHTVAFGPLGTSDHALFTGSDPILSQDWSVSAAVLLEVPTWWDAYLSTTGAPIADHFRNSSNAQASSLADAGSANLKQGSLDFRVRESGAGIANTPIFIAYDEPLVSEDLTRSGTAPNNDPNLTNKLDILNELHSSWFGYILVNGVSANQTTNRLSDSVLYVERGYQYQRGSHNAIMQFGAADPRIDTAAANFVEDKLQPGLWESKGNVAGQIDTSEIADKAVTYSKIQDTASDARILGRAFGAGPGSLTELTQAQANAVLWSLVGDHSLLVTQSISGFPAPLQFQPNGVFARVGSGDILSATVGAGQIVYRPQVGDLGVQSLSSACNDSGIYNASFPIFAEENGSLSTTTGSGWAFSFGNGGTGPNTGLKMRYPGKITGLDVTWGNTANTSTLTVTINDVDTTVTATGDGVSKHASSPDTSVSFNKGDLINIKVTATGGTVTGPTRPAVWIERTG